jgi:hypothetical protein
MMTFKVYYKFDNATLNCLNIEANSVKEAKKIARDQLKSMFFIPVPKIAFVAIKNAMGNYDFVN